MSRRDFYDDPQAPPANSIVPAVTVAVIEDGNVLLVHRVDNDKWALPGGAVDIGESVPETAVREVREETGVDIEVDGIVGIFSDPRHVIAYDDGEVRQQFAICLRGRAVGGQLRTSSESTEVAWVPIAHLGELDMHPTQRLRLGYATDPAHVAPYIG